MFLPKGIVYPPTTKKAEAINVRNFIFSFISALLILFSWSAIAEQTVDLEAFDADRGAEVCVLSEPIDVQVNPVERLRTAHSVDSVDNEAHTDHNEAVLALLAGHRGDSPILRYDKAAA